jgi:hypothetical protein
MPTLASLTMKNAFSLYEITQFSPLRNPLAFANRKACRHRYNTKTHDFSVNLLKTNALRNSVKFSDAFTLLTTLLIRSNQSVDAA